MIQNVALKGFLSVLGAFSITLSLGLMYLWGIIAVYATSYFRITTKDITLTQIQTGIVFPLMLLGQALSIPFAARFAKKVSARLTCMVCGGLISCLLYMSSYCESLTSFSIIFGLFSGIIIGIIYIFPISHCYRYFPNHQTAVSMIITIASGIGTFIFGIVAYYTLNSHNYPLQKDGFYNIKIAEQFPSYLRTLSLIILVIVELGSLLLFDFPSSLMVNIDDKLLKAHKKGPKNLSSLMNTEFMLAKDEEEAVQTNPFGQMNYEMKLLNKDYDHTVYGEKQDREFWPSINQRQSSQYHPSQINDQKKTNTQQTLHSLTDILNECPRTSDGPKEGIFWILFIILMLGTNFGLIISVNYRTYAKNSILDDKFLTLTGCLGAFFCGCSRFLCAFFLQKISFKVLYSILLIINAFLAFTIFYVDNFAFIYLVYVLIAYFCYGGHLGMFPALTSQIFGLRYGSQIYGLLFYAYPASNFIQFFLINFFRMKYSFWLIFIVSGGMSVAALLISNRTQYKNDWSQRIRQNNERKRILTR